jgi:hypothetical protein
VRVFLCFCLTYSSYREINFKFERIIYQNPIQKKIISTTYTLPSAVRTAGGIFALVGILAVFINPITIFLPLLGSAAFLYQNGMILDTEKKRFKAFKGFAFARLGEWRRISSMKYLFMSKRTARYSLYSLPNVKMEVKDTAYFIGFTQNPEKDLFDFKRFKTMMEADKEGRELAQFFDLQLLKSKNFQ